MSASITLASFRQDVKNRLNEAGNTSIGELATGSGGAATVATDTTIADLAMDGARLLARTSYPLRGAFAYSVASNTRFVRLLDMTPDTGAVPQAPTGAELWRPMLRGVYWGSTRLRHAASWAIRDPLATAAAPTYWYDQGEAIALAAIPTGTGTLKAIGFYLPPAAASSGAMFPMFPDDVVHSALEFYVCALLAAKNVDDEDLAQRGAMWMSEFDAARLRYYGELGADDRAYLPPLLPTKGA